MDLEIECSCSAAVSCSAAIIENDIHSFDGKLSVAMLA